MNLAIDIGNTRIKIGVFDEAELVHSDAFRIFSEQEVASLIAKHNIKTAIVSSTRKTKSVFEQRVAKHIPLMKLTHLTPLPITNTYHTPETLGKDRLAAVVACTAKFKDSNCLVIDAGTCITYDLITRDKVYLGGNIAPGLRMRSQAMDEFTSALPFAEPVFHEDPLGKTTEMALQNGVVYGTFLEMQSFIKLMNTKFPDLNVILTGGDSQFFANLLNSKIFADANLVLFGLNEILRHNAA